MPELGPDHVAVMDALAGLDPDQRTVVVLRYLADLGTAEIARELGVPEGTVAVITGDGGGDNRPAPAPAPATESPTPTPTEATRDARYDLVAEHLDPAGEHLAPSDGQEFTWPLEPPYGFTTYGRYGRYGLHADGADELMS